MKVCTIDLYGHVLIEIGQAGLLHFGSCLTLAKCETSQTQTKASNTLTLYYYFSSFYFYLNICSRYEALIFTSIWHSNSLKQAAAISFLFKNLATWECALQLWRSIAKPILSIPFSKVSQISKGLIFLCIVPLNTIKCKLADNFQKWPSSV